MQVVDQLSAMDALVSKGQIVDAVDQFFADNAQTLDFDGTATQNKEEMLEKMRGFAGAIKEVNGITLHHSTVGPEVSMSEYTFDFNMADGSHVLWHEIIRRKWKDGKVIHEQYFKN